MQCTLSETRRLLVRYQKTETRFYASVASKSGLRVSVRTLPAVSPIGESGTDIGTIRVTIRERGVVTMSGDYDLPEITKRNITLQ